MHNKNTCDYERSMEYWSEIPATVDGVLGGFGFISSVDIQGSTAFLKSLLSRKNKPNTELALDCGAGIGRIAKYLLIPHFETVDIIEPDEKFLEAVKGFVGENHHKIDKLYKLSLHEFRPEKQYDIIWNQWVLGYLNDVDLVNYLKRCSEALTENGIIVVKENVTSSGKNEKDDVDSSVTRSLKQFLHIFKQSNLKIICQCKQNNFPHGLYPVYMFALIPEAKDKTGKKPENLLDTLDMLDLNT